MLTCERLKELIHYDPETGIFTWKVSKSGIVQSQAGWLKPDGYQRICIDRKTHYAQILAWFYVTEEWPIRDIDHKNRKPGDNRFCNLRLATESQNMANARLSKKNKSGYKGVSWDLRCQKWRAQIQVNRKIIYIGLFATKEAAYAAYCVAAEKYYGEFAEGNRYAT